MACERQPFALQLLVTELLVTVLASACSAPQPAVNTAPASSVAVQVPDKPFDGRVDWRREPHDFADPAWLERLSSSSAALISKFELTIDGDRVQLSPRTLRQTVNLCEDERFAEQPAVAFCSATLIAPDLVLTAGHCVESRACSHIKVVFGYLMDQTGTPKPLAPSDVYSCQSEVARRNDSGIDYAVLELDRPVSGRAPAALERSRGALHIDAPLIYAGYPGGTPLKITDHGRVTDGRTEQRDYFVSDIDAFRGSSGAAVFSKTSERVIGVLSRSPEGTDPAGYVNDNGGCFRQERIWDPASRVEVTYVNHALEHLCRVRATPGLCACGDRRCDTTAGETTASCEFDCGVACGDGRCAASENSAECYADCGACGNGVCEATERSQSSCCTDCGCNNAHTCTDQGCVAALGNANSDGQLDRADARAIRRSHAGLESEIQERAADVDCNGLVNAQDASALDSSIRTGALLPCERATDVATGPKHTCALFASGQLRCFGDNTFGQLGTGVVNVKRQTLKEAPALVFDAPVAQLAVGDRHSCVLLKTGVVRCWGNGTGGELGDGRTLVIGDDEPASAGLAVAVAEPVAAITAGAAHTCALTRSGRVKCWGANDEGQLGYGHRAKVGDDEPLDAVGFVELGSRAVAVSAGDAHTCAVLTGGGLKCWGANLFGQLGLGHQQNIGDDEVPSQIAAIKLSVATRAVAAGGGHTCAILRSGQLHCWGDNALGQLGISGPHRIGDDELPSSAPALRTPERVLGVTAGFLSTCARFVSGSVRCWGGGAGSVTVGALSSASPSKGNSFPNSALLRGRGDAHCTVSSAGALTCWGQHHGSQLRQLTPGAWPFVEAGAP